MGYSTTPEPVTLHNSYVDAYDLFMPTIDVSLLHTLTEDLAGFLSEVTHGDLSRPIPGTTGDLADLYRHLLEQNIATATTVAGKPISRIPLDLDARVDVYGGCGLESDYRRTARLMEDAFAATEAVDAATLYDAQISNTVIRTWDVAEALGLHYRPDPAVTQRVLRSFATQTPPTAPDIFDCVLTLSGRKTVA